MADPSSRWSCAAPDRGHRLELPQDPGLARTYLQISIRSPLSGNDLYRRIRTSAALEDRQGRIFTSLQPSQRPGLRLKGADLTREPLQREVLGKGHHLLPH